MSRSRKNATVRSRSTRRSACVSKPKHYPEIVLPSPIRHRMGALVTCDGSWPDSSRPNWALKTELLKEISGEAR